MTFPIPPHHQEWLDSCVATDIIEANVRYYAGETALQVLTEDAIAALGGHAHQYVTVAARQILDRYTHVEAGGWWVSGLDPLQHWERMLWGQFKPSTPRPNPDKPDKVIKYESPCRIEARAIFLEVPSSPDLWPQVQQNPSIPIVLLEGAKKAGCVLTAGFVAIALPGIWMGLRSQPAPHLIPELALFAQPGRQFIFAFDQDDKAKTRLDVQRAAWATAQLLSDQGCECFTTDWETSEGKGIDDVAQAVGRHRVIEILSAPVPLVRPLEIDEPDPTEYQRHIAAEAEQERLELIADVERERAIQAAKQTETPEQTRDRQIARRRFRFQQFWEGGLQRDFTLSETPKRQLNRYQGYAPDLPLTDSATIELQGGYGAGKTETILRSLGVTCENVSWISIRNGLLRDTAARAQKKNIATQHFQDDVPLGQEMVRDGHPGILFMAYASLSEYHFKGVDWRTRTAVIDEFSSLRKEILQYPNLLNEFERMLRDCKTLIVADANLSDADVAVIRSYRKQKRVILAQDFEPDPTPVKWLETRNRSGAISMTHDGIYLGIIQQWIREGLTIGIATDSATHARVLTEFGAEFGCTTQLAWSKSIEANQALLEDINAGLESIQIFSYTPTLQNGADVQRPFDRVLVIATGVLPALQIVQIGKRIRNAGEIWVSAPRKTIDPISVSLSLESEKIKQMGAKIGTVLSSEGIDAPLSMQGWGVWERTTAEIERAFNSEYVEALLNRNFSNVQTVEVALNEPAQWQERVRQLKDADALRMLKSNLQAGQELLIQKKQPTTEKQAWALELAQLHQKYPKVVKPLIAQVESDESVAEAVAIARVFISKRLDKLKYWRMAEEENVIDDERLSIQLKRGRITYAASGIRQRQYVKLYQRLKLKELAIAAEKLQPETSGFTAKSAAIGRLWNCFQADAQLQALFPLLTNQEQLWTEIKRCMAFLGFERVGHNCRVTTERQHPNGRDRNGNQRYSRSASRYFVGWKPMAASGNLVFQTLFSEIVDAISEILATERAEYLSWRDRQLDVTEARPPTLRGQFPAA